MELGKAGDDMAGSIHDEVDRCGERERARRRKP
jgi:hypothetical protein